MKQFLSTIAIVGIGIASVGVAIAQTTPPVPGAPAARPAPGTSPGPGYEFKEAERALRDIRFEFFLKNLDC